MDKNRIIGLFLGLFMFILLFPSLNQYCVEIGTHENATGLEVTVTSILPILFIAFIMCYAVLILVEIVREMR